MMGFDGFLMIHRHPLQELVVDTFVSNDVIVKAGSEINAVAVMNGAGEDDATRYANSCLLVTGANACGKVSMFLV